MDYWAKSVYSWHLFLTEIYPQNSITIQKTVWCREFRNHAMIYRWVNKLRTHGTVHNLSHKDSNRQSHSGRPKSSRTPHNVAEVRNSVSGRPSKSVRWRSQLLRIPRESEQRIYCISQSVCLQDTPHIPQKNHWHG